MHTPSAHMTRHGAADTINGATPTAASQPQPSARPVPMTASPATTRSRRSPIQERNRPVLSVGWFAISMLSMIHSIFACRLDGRIDLGRTIPDLVDHQWTGLLAGHPRRALGHTGQADPGDLWLLRKQPVDDLDGDVPADDVAADQRDMARRKIIRDAVFLAHQGQIVGRDRSHLEPVITEVVGIPFAAAALRVLVKRDLSPISGGCCVERYDPRSASDQGGSAGPANQDGQDGSAA